MTITNPSRFIAVIAAVAVAALALTGSPAHADRDRTVRTIATILGLAVVGKIIHDNNKKSRSDDAPETHPPAVHRPRVGTGHVTRPLHPRPRPLPHRVDRSLLPGECFYSVPTYRGSVQMFGERCLRRSYRFVNQLPQSCSTQVRTQRGVSIGYEARCLRRNGYRLARS